MELTLKNRLIVPYSDKETFKVIFGDTQTFQFELPTPHVAGDTYALGLDQERVVYPPSRPLCAYSTAFTVENDVLTMTLKYNTNRLRSFVCTLKKPTTIYIQLDRIRDGKADTLLLDTLLAMPSVLDSVNTVCEGDPLAELLDEKMDKPAVEGTVGQILALDENGQCVWKDEQEIPEQEQANWDESDSSDPSYIQHKPTLSAVATSGSYNDLTDKPELATVATSGSYDDLTDKPVIPEQKQADWDESDSTDASYIQHKPDLSAYSLVTETGNRLSMSIDEDYDLVVRLLDKHDNVLSTQDIDLPLESMIVNASYANGVLTLTLQNGQTVDVDISDIVSGLVPDSRTINGQSLSSDVTLTAQDLSLATVATSGDYDDLSNKPDLSLKLDAPSVAGTVGQVLTKTATGQEWADAQGGGSDGNPDYLAILFGNDNSTITLAKVGTPSEISLEYSLDKTTWTALVPDTAITIPTVWTKCYFRGNNTGFSINKHNYYNFVFGGGQAYIYGNVMSLLDASCTSVTIPAGCSFQSLFEYRDGSKIKSFELALPAISLTEGCYKSMFKNQGDMIGDFPSLPATELRFDCYNGMFDGCGELTGKVILPATVPVRNCYSGMLRGCGKIRYIDCNFLPEYYFYYYTSDWLQNAGASSETPRYFCMPYGTYSPGTSDSEIPDRWTRMYKEVPCDLVNSITQIEDALSFHNN